MDSIKFSPMKWHDDRNYWNLPIAKDKLNGILKKTYCEWLGNKIDPYYFIKGYRKFIRHFILIYKGSRLIVLEKNDDIFWIKTKPNDPDSGTLYSDNRLDFLMKSGALIVDIGIKPELMTDIEIYDELASPNKNYTSHKIIGNRVYFYTVNNEGDEEIKDTYTIDKTGKLI